MLPKGRLQKLPRIPDKPGRSAGRARALTATPLLACPTLAAAFHGLPPRVLASIHAVEGGDLGSVHRNVDGSQDLGPRKGSRG